MTADVKRIETRLWGMGGDMVTMGAYHFSRLMNLELKSIGIGIESKNWGEVGPDMLIKGDDRLTIFAHTPIPLTCNFQDGYCVRNGGGVS